MKRLGLGMAFFVTALKRLSLVCSVFVLSACGSGGGGTDSLPVLPPTPVAPVITAQPSSVSVTTGQPATFSVTATGTEPRLYQWKRGGVDIAGATSSTYTIAAAALADSGASFTVAVANAAGTVLSQPAAVLTVTPPVAPSFVTAPSSASVVAGSTASFSVVAAGTGPLSYQWSRGGVDIPGAQSSSYSLVTTLADNNASLTVRVSNREGSITSPPVSLRVSATFEPVSIVVQPVDTTVRVGEQAAFSVTLQGTGPFSLQWFRGTELIATLTQTTSLQHLYLYATPATLADSGSLFSLRVSDTGGNSVTSRQAKLTVLP